MNRLDKVYRFDTGVMTLKAYLKSKEWVEKVTHIRNHSKKRIHLEYKKIRDTYEYMVFDKNGIGVSIPKAVYDTLDLPERISDNRF